MPFSTHYQVVFTHAKLAEITSPARHWLLALKGFGAEKPGEKFGGEAEKKGGGLQSLREGSIAKTVPALCSGRFLGLSHLRPTSFLSERDSPASGCRKNPSHAVLCTTVRRLSAGQFF